MNDAPFPEVIGSLLSTDQLVQRILSAGMEVHGQLGPGYLELVYQEALVLEFTLRGIQHVREVYVPIAYKGHRLSFSFRADFICYGSIVLELKAVQGLSAKDDPQLRSYLNATGHAHGLLLNFGAQRLQYKRINVDQPR